MDALRILIVDDEDELVTTLVERLRMRGIEASGVNSGEEALELLESKLFDVLLVDVKMPGLGGLQLVCEVKSRRPNQQVVLLSGHGSIEDAEKGKELGVFDYVLKPVAIEKLVELLRHAAMT